MKKGNKLQFDVQQFERYMQSKEWAIVSERIKKRDGYKCRSCGSPFDLIVHHLNYKHVGKEKDKDLITLCFKCLARLNNDEIGVR